VAGFETQVAASELALSYAEVDAIRERFEHHSPYRRSAEPTLLRLEPENFASADGQTYLYAVASKRKTPYVNGADQADPVSPSAFALGHLRHPANLDGADQAWIPDAWSWAALAGCDPDWLDNPAYALSLMSRYADLARLGGKRKNGPRPYDPLVVAYADQHLGQQEDGQLPKPVSIYTPGFTVEHASWRDFMTGRTLERVRSAPQQIQEQALTRGRPTYIRTLRTLLTGHLRAPERKALAADGTPCSARTAGLLRPAPTEAFAAIPIGRETNYADTVGVLSEAEYTVFPDSSRNPSVSKARAILTAVARSPAGRAELLAALDVSDRTLRRYLRTGRCSTLNTATRVAAAKAAQILRLTEEDAAAYGSEALLYLAARLAEFAEPVCQGCGAPLVGRQQRWCPVCRNRPRLRARTGSP
jgi:hypothetical protein